MMKSVFSTLKIYTQPILDPGHGASKGLARPQILSPTKSKLENVQLWLWHIQEVTRPNMNPA